MVFFLPQKITCFSVILSLLSGGQPSLGKQPLIMVAQRLFESLTKNVLHLKSMGLNPNYLLSKSKINTYLINSYANLTNETTD